jgi:Zinc carboxypeptidase
MKRRDFLSTITTIAGVNSPFVNSFLNANEPVNQRRWPTLEQIQSKLEEWKKLNPKKMILKEAGKSIDGNSIPLVILTDQSVPDEDKEHILVTTLHSGIERSATTSALYFIKWLLSDDPVAQESLKKQVVICMPVVNPDGYLAGTFTNKKGKDPYLAWTLDGPSDPENSPEIVAVQKIMDQYQPEVLSDMHGLDLTIDNYLMVEISGPAYSNSALRPYHQRISQLMEEAAVKAGFPMDRAEQDAEKLFWGPQLNPIAHKLWLGRPRVYGAMYCYNKFHSLILTSECAWEKSAQVRHRRLLQIGNGIWPGELYEGYPTRTILRNSFHLVTAYGQTASARRKSRVELWSKFQHFSHGMDNPQQVGKVTYICSTSAEERKKWIPDNTLRGFSEKIASHPKMNAKVIQNHLKDHADGEGQWGKLAHIYLYGKNAPSKERVVIQNGLALRLRVPYSKATINQLHLNGFPCKPSSTDGFQTWSARGFTHIQVNIPPQKSSQENFWVITLDYDPNEKRKQGWESVLDKNDF